VGAVDGRQSPVVGYGASLLVTGTGHRLVLTENPTPSRRFTDDRRRTTDD